MKIPNELLPQIYRVSKDVYEKSLSLTEGVSLLSHTHNMNESSARDYIYDFRYMMQGKQFTRTLNASSMEFFLNGIYTDYGKSQLTIALSALKQHIEYYEAQGNGQLLKTRKVYDRLFSTIQSGELIRFREDLINNIAKIEYYLAEGDEIQKLEASRLIVGGICFIAYDVKGEVRFAPSKFLGYLNNSIESHIKSERDGGDTNESIYRILGSKPAPNIELERKYINYCHNLGLNPGDRGSFGAERKYWMLKLEKDFESNEQLTGEFPEGKLVERLHRSRERNSKVIQVAKENFRKLHGRLYCQVCEFDFKDTYGQIGADFIEGHHTIAVKDMPPDYKTKPEEIAMLCANCHRMVHKKRPWLSMAKLSELLRIKRHRL
jgi:hypothetical protein